MNYFGDTCSGADRIDLENPSVIGFFQESFAKYWDVDAFTDYNGETLKYGDVAKLVDRFHFMFRAMGLEPQDKVAICGRNCSMWAVSFLAVFTYGAVPVPILNDFQPDYIHNIVEHSDAKLLFVGKALFTKLNADLMPHLEGIVSIEDAHILVSRNQGLSSFAYNGSNNVRPDTLEYFVEKDAHELAILNYTSGTTSAPKGVMVPYRAIRTILIYSHNTVPMKPGSSTVNILPLAHMFGLMFELLYEIMLGCHIHFLNRVPSPNIIFKSFAEFKPTLIITVPLVLEKIICKMIFPQLEKRSMRIALKTPVLSRCIKNKIKNKLVNAFGGDMLEVIVGGAALNPEVEDFLHDIRFPYLVGYGMTECAPLIAYSHWYEFVKGSCSRAITGVQVRIEPFESGEVGEILVKGDNVMLGYYKNPQATASVLDADGWLHTGDVGYIDKDGNIFIRGRIKNLILGPSGQNIYPEEIENKFNMQPYVQESVVIREKDGKLVALVYPAADALKEARIDLSSVPAIMEQNRKNVNSQISSYEQIAAVRIVDKEFEKTPKKSIKRFLYQPQ